jgi:hypothetical protein
MATRPLRLAPPPSFLTYACHSLHFDPIHQACFVSKVVEGQLKKKAKFSFMV